MGDRLRAGRAGGTGVVQVWQMLALSFITGCAQAFGGPAYQSLMPSLVPASTCRTRSP